MASTSGGNSGKYKRKIWDESPNTFTEFGALSSEMRPSGGFFARLLKRNKGELLEYYYFTEIYNRDLSLDSDSFAYMWYMFLCVCLLPPEECSSNIRTFVFIK